MDHNPVVTTGKTVMDQLTGIATDTFQAVCNCEWTGPIRARYDDAEEDCNQHEMDER